ncbi:hypothetical protein [Desulfosarcina sp. BuS5]|uniref:hypothetical protein n=1 Tax=Desulfosarcina sp. BuS5 TaxID=933262 RepID=UPI0018DB49B1|nr:hypothetical protein [Desulfosarcina sp. BuS5]
MTACPTPGKSQTVSILTISSDAQNDPDNDGLTNLKEFNNQTNPKNPDSDGDGMPDGWEVINNLDPNSNDADNDEDSDDLTNFLEFSHETNPFNGDTDNDGISDYDEVNSGMDPNSGKVVNLSFDQNDVTISLCGENSIYFTVKNLVDIYNQYKLDIKIEINEQVMDPAWYSLEKKGFLSTWQPITGDSIFMLYGSKKAFRIKFNIPCECETPEADYTLTITASVKDNGAIDPVEASANIHVDKKPHITPLNFNPDDNTFHNAAGNSIFVSWLTDVETSTEIYYKKIDDESFSTLTGAPGKEHRMLLDNLEWGTSYIWYVKSVSDCNEFAETKPILSTTGKAITFVSGNHEFTVNRDYDQQAELTVVNNDSESGHELLLSVINPYDDIITGFIGEGSVNHLITLAPGETKNVKLVIHAQDASKTDYNLLLKVVSDPGSEKEFTDYAPVILHVPDDFFVLNLDLQETSQDFQGFKNTYRITNYGHPLTDLVVYLNDEAIPIVTLTPTTDHGKLETGEYLEFTLSSTEYVSGHVYAASRNISGAPASLAFELGCGPNFESREFEVADPVIACRIADWYCINRPVIELPFTLPPRFFDFRY